MLYNGPGCSWGVSSASAFLRSRCGITKRLERPSHAEPEHHLEYPGGTYFHHYSVLRSDKEQSTNSQNRCNITARPNSFSKA